MKEYLEGRIVELEKEYNEKLVQPVKAGGNIDDSNKKILWCETECVRARLLEVRKTLEFHKENNYTNL